MPTDVSARPGLILTTLSRAKRCVCRWCRLLATRWPETRLKVVSRSSRTLPALTLPPPFSPAEQGSDRVLDITSRPPGGELWGLAGPFECEESKTQQVVRGVGADGRAPEDDVLNKRCWPGFWVSAAVHRRLKTGDPGRRNGDLGRPGALGRVQARRGQSQLSRCDAGPGCAVAPEDRARAA